MITPVSQRERIYPGNGCYLMSDDDLVLGQSSRGRQSAPIEAPEFP